ncbi:hypothetical protein EHS25_004908 [Saitozyma podzolica]|uniref:Uncharacterized protein n=1 Tax=Saitozyma podzolica TaxID=1890683 RepID=A0A427Y331_9TREE|nr:hypothetical protein EHS25_004908 [Saitozyma podzolica]
MKEKGGTTDGLDAAHTTHIRCHTAIVQAVPSTSAACWNDELKACGRTDVSSRASHEDYDHVFLSFLTDTPPSQAIKSYGLQVPVSKGLPVHESFHRPHEQAKYFIGTLYQPLGASRCDWNPPSSPETAETTSGSPTPAPGALPAGENIDISIVSLASQASQGTSPGVSWQRCRRGRYCPEGTAKLMGKHVSSTAREKRNRHSPGDRPFRPMVFFLGGMMLRQLRDALKSRKVLAGRVYSMLGRRLSLGLTEGRSELLGALGV